MEELSLQNEVTNAKLSTFEAMVNEMRTEMMAMRVELSAKCQCVSVYAVHFHEFECGVNTAGN